MNKMQELSVAFVEQSPKGRTKVDRTREPAPS
jgi:hypothetical protein